MILEAERALDAAARLPSSAVQHGPAPMVAWPPYRTSELGIPHLDARYILLHLLSFTVRCYQLLVKSMVEVA